VTTRLFDGVLLDWSGTLVNDPKTHDRVRWALRELDRPAPDEQIKQILYRLRRAAELPEVREARRDYDCSAERHRAGQMLMFHRAGLDAQLAEQLYGFDAQPANRPLFPDVLDVLRALRARGVRLVVLSDIHLDVRILMTHHGVGDLVDDYVLSCEHGRQKPDPDLFRIALAALGTLAERSLMVGDLPDKDGAATAIGITTLILPRALAHPERPRLGPLRALFDL
jgi:HAD superfamily hydrolase (TIGR01509 family)